MSIVALYWIFRFSIRSIKCKSPQKRCFYRVIFRFHFAPRHSVPHAENAVREETTPLYLTRNGAPFWFFRVWSTRYLAVRAHLANEWCYPKHILLKMSIKTKWIFRTEKTGRHTTHVYTFITPGSKLNMYSVLLEEAIGKRRRADDFETATRPRRMNR